MSSSSGGSAVAPSSIAWIRPSHHSILLAGARRDQALVWATREADASRLSRTTWMKRASGKRAVQGRRLGDVVGALFDQAAALAGAEAEQVEEEGSARRPRGRRRGRPRSARPRRRSGRGRRTGTCRASGWSESRATRTPQAGEELRRGHLAGEQAGKVGVGGSGLDRDQAELVDARRAWASTWVLLRPVPPMKTSGTASGGRSTSSPPRTGEGESAGLRKPSFIGRPGERSGSGRRRRRSCRSRCGSPGRRPSSAASSPSQTRRSTPSALRLLGLGADLDLDRAALGRLSSPAGQKAPRPASMYILSSDGGSLATACRRREPQRRCEWYWSESS